MVLANDLQYDPYAQYHALLVPEFVTAMVSGTRNPRSLGIECRG